MKTINISESTAVVNPHGIEAKKLFDSESIKIVHIHLKPGEKITKHSAPIDVFFYVLEGNGIVEIGSETKEVSVNTLIASPANQDHGWTNTGLSVLRILVFKTTNSAHIKD